MNLLIPLIFVGIGLIITIVLLIRTQNLRSYCYSDLDKAESEIYRLKGTCKYDICNKANKEIGNVKRELIHFEKLCDERVKEREENLRKRCHTWQKQLES
jgi:hypothetical protein